MTLFLAGMLPPTSSIFNACYENPLRGGCHFLATPVPTLLRSRVSLKIEARGIPRKESAKIRNRRMRRKFNGTQTKPRLSVFCSTRQLYAMLVDDHNKKTLFYASTLQNSMREDPPCSTSEAARRVGEALVQACTELQISEISSYDRNGFARGERMQAFEVAIAQYGLLSR
ncbi:uncharacterized protein LOC110036442 [Phalaenopsis equestris]|uniref:uncharacterized protein LOC110036022 n=1 Tax=Phalaenopsis equestris TaxID=78828 RepID=UPI0009E5FF89|nr:uncharacterized protein LOC110036022 [Phalaenopsis equestris]XP_020596029.1 uncharacterized protein LOC110036022 [Phalaenopsis equestris]XP_020596548.1 uncharacterized protein LOC110036442 [Phalaenopsis equestris]